MTLRFRDRETVIPAGESVAFDEIAAALRGSGSAAAVVMAFAPRAEAPPPTAASSGLRADAEARRRAFDAAMVAGDADGALEQALGLEQDIHAWSADTLQSDDIDIARSILRAMLVEFATVAQSGLRDESEVIGPFIELALDVRRRAREAKDFATSDAVRDGLVALGIEVRDTPDGAAWERLGR
jgi:cysteinyl-tRNA synthetase